MKPLHRRLWPRIPHVAPTETICPGRPFPLDIPVPGESTGHATLGSCPGGGVHVPGPLRLQTQVYCSPPKFGILGTHRFLIADIPFSIYSEFRLAGKTFPLAAAPDRRTPRCFAQQKSRSA